MEADPHKNTSAIYMDVVRDLNLIREDVAAAARAAADGDKVQYRARLMQAKQLMGLVSYIHGSWTDAYCVVLRECCAPEEPTAATVEAKYSERLVTKLENIVETAWISCGGRAGEVALRAKENTFEADIAVEAARMMHESIAVYAEAYIARLRDRLSGLHIDAGPRP